MVAELLKTVPRENPATKVRASAVLHSAGVPCPYRRERTPQAALFLLPFHTEASLSLPPLLLYSPGIFSMFSKVILFFILKVMQT